MSLQEKLCPGLVRTRSLLHETVAQPRRSMEDGEATLLQPQLPSKRRTQSYGVSLGHHQLWLQGSQPGRVSLLESAFPRGGLTVRRQSSHFRLHPEETIRKHQSPAKEASLLSSSLCVVGTAGPNHPAPLTWPHAGSQPVSPCTLLLSWLSPLKAKTNPHRCPCATNKNSCQRLPPNGHCSLTQSHFLPSPQLLGGRVPTPCMSSGISSLFTDVLLEGRDAQMVAG